jgi:hypothetical protein
MGDALPPLSLLALSVRPGIYRHYKGGEYRVLGVARHAEHPTDELVVYTSVETGALWVRPLAMFVEQVDYGGTRVSRFAMEREGPVTN